MILSVINSGSEANGYIIQNDNEALFLECGCKLSEVKKALDWNVRKIVGCLISHEHLDHAGRLSEYMKAGIPVYSAFQTQTALEIITGERTTAISPLKKIQIGNFTVTPFNVPHDADIECYGYLIEHEEIGKLLFLTDLEYCKYNFSKQNVNHILCECNYDKDLVDENYENSLRNRVLKTHMELRTFLNFISTNDNPALRNVVLLHLSDKNGNPVEFLQKTKETVKYGTDCYIAEKGLEVDLSLCPF